MGLNILIAESYDVFRAGLRAIFEEDSRVANVHEVTNKEDLRAELLSSQMDLIVINQSLVTEITALPKEQFVILSDEPSVQQLKQAYQHGARGYFSPKVSAELLRTMLHPANAFLIEPTLIPWIMKHFVDHPQFSIRSELLTPREKEIVSLLQEGYDRPSIARQLCIAETTLKTHIKNISKKRDQDAAERLNLEGWNISKVRLK